MGVFATVALFAVPVTRCHFSGDLTVGAASIHSMTGKIPGACARPDAVTCTVEVRLLPARDQHRWTSPDRCWLTSIRVSSLDALDALDDGDEYGLALARACSATG